VPPFEIAAVKVTGDPAQKGFCEGITVTLTGCAALTTMATWLDMAGTPLLQSALEVSWQVTTSPFRGIYE